MRNDTPAALPLLFLIAGLATGPYLVNPHAAIAALVLVAALPLTGRADRRLLACAFAALGIALALRVQSRDAAERRAFDALDAEGFVRAVAPIERDWAARDDSFVLRASRFEVEGGARFDTPLSIYVRFDPPEIADETHVRVEGFLRTNERGEYLMSVKTPELMRYEGALRWWDPKAWNRALANRLERSAPLYPDEVALAQALLLGRGERLTAELREDFRRGGTYHLLVFSGLQIAFAAALLAALLRWMHAPRASDWLLLAFAAIAPAFIGPTASVSRASIGIGLYAMSRILKRPTSMENLWCVAALLRLALEPRDLTNVSFHLTYAGAGALIFIGRHLLERRWLSHVVAAEIAITPLTLHHFHQYALGGAVVTMLMSPIVFAMLVVSLLACAWPRALVAIAILNRVCALLNAGGFAGWFAAPPLPALIASCAAALLALAFLQQRRRAIVIAVLLTVASASAVARSIAGRAVDDPAVTFFDVGQGDALAVRAGRHTVVVDGGRDGRILPMLADLGVRSIDAIVLTHAHPDHCGGLAPLIAHMNVRRVLVSPRRFRGDCAAEILDACSRTATMVVVVRDGDRFDAGAIHMQAFTADQTFRRSPENNASIVLRLDLASRRFLLTGDIEREAEIYFRDRDFRADVLKVPHHGSRSSTSGAFLDVVRPRLAVISCGRRNLFGHPHADVIEVLREAGVRIWRTDIDGTVEVSVRKGRLYARSRRD